MSTELLPVPPSFRHGGHTYELDRDRIVRDGKDVGVLVSPGYGAGFVTWNPQVPPFQPQIVVALIMGRKDLILGPHEARHLPDRCAVCRDHLVKISEELGYGDDLLYLGGAEDLKVKWIPLGSQFEIDEYDGSESVRILGPATGYRA